MKPWRTESCCSVAGWGCLFKKRRLGGWELCRLPGLSTTLRLSAFLLPLFSISLVCLGEVFQGRLGDASKKVQFTGLGFVLERTEEEF